MTPNISSFRLFVLTFVAFLGLGLNSVSIQAQFDDSHIRAVDQNAPGGPGDPGATWQNAYIYLEDALAYASTHSEITEIWVAAATYYPDECDSCGSGGTDDRDDTFSLVNGVSVYGGFLNGDDFEDRDPEINITILSGDIDQNDGPNFADNDGNSISVVTAEDVDPSAVLDGFTITAGNANDLPAGAGRGAGINCRDFAASPTINRCIIKDNFAWVWGAGMYCGANCRAIISNCTFQGNVAHINDSGTGAAVYCLFAAPAIINCTFAFNQARRDAGAIFVRGTSDPPEDLTITNCVFTNNQARRRGGAIYVDGTITYSIPAVAITNSLFADNWVQGIPGDPQSGRGGAIYCRRGKMDVICSTIVDNQAVEGGGVAIRVDFALPGDPMDIRDTIVFGNVASGAGAGPPGNQLWISVGIFGFFVLTVDYCDVEGGLADVGGDGSGYWGDNNIDDDPLFVDPYNDNYRLGGDSPCIDFGDPDETVIPCDEFDLDNDGDTCDPPNNYEPTPDLDLGDRVVDGDEDMTAVVDMGAYESVPCPWDLDGSCDVSVADLLLLLAAWGPNPGHPADFDGDDEVGVSDLLALLANWGACPCDPEAEPLSLEDELEDACLSQADWDEFVDKMQNGTEEEKENYLCWMEHYLFDCNKCTCTHLPMCHGPDPFS